MTRVTFTSLRRLVTVLVLTVCGLFGCIARPPLTCPGKGGPVWSEIRSPHFIVKTDLPVNEGKRISAEIEAARAALLVALDAPADDAALPVEVIVFERSVDFDSISHRTGLLGYFAPHLAGDLELQPVIVASGGLTRESRRILMHELTHQILRRRTARLPWWLDEGVAETYSTLWIEDGKIIMGQPPADRGFWAEAYPVLDMGGVVPKRRYPHTLAPTLDELLRADRTHVEQSGNVDVHYIAAWKLIHVLSGHTNHAHIPRFKSMMHALMSGTDGFEAFAHAYKGAPFSEIEAEYGALLLDEREYLQDLAFEPPPQPAPQTATLTDADAHALWARLLAERQRYTAAAAGSSAEDQVDLGLAETPGAPELLYVDASIRVRAGDTLPQRDIDRLLKLDPANPRYLTLALATSVLRWFRLGDRTLTDGMHDKLTAFAAKLVPVVTSPSQRTFAATALSALGRNDEARVMIEKATQTEPSCRICFEAYAEILLTLGEPSKAQTAFDRTVALSPEGSNLRGLESLRNRIQAAVDSASGKSAEPPPAQ